MRANMNHRKFTIAECENLDWLAEPCQDCDGKDQPHDVRVVSHVDSNGFSWHDSQTFYGFPKGSCSQCARCRADWLQSIDAEEAMRAEYERRMAEEMEGDRDE